MGAPWNVESAGRWRRVAFQLAQVHPSKATETHDGPTACHTHLLFGCFLATLSCCGLLPRPTATSMVRVERFVVDSSISYGLRSSSRQRGVFSHTHTLLWRHNRDVRVLARCHPEPKSCKSCTGAKFATLRGESLDHIFSSSSLVLCDVLAVRVSWSYSGP